MKVEPFIHGYDSAKEGGSMTLDWLHKGGTIMVQSFCF